MQTEILYPSMWNDKNTAIFEAFQAELDSCMLPATTVFVTQISYNVDGKVLDFSMFTRISNLGATVHLCAQASVKEIAVSAVIVNYRASSGDSIKFGPTDLTDNELDGKYPTPIEFAKLVAQYVNEHAWQIATLSSIVSNAA